MKPPELFAALYQRFKLNLIRRAHNALYELGLGQSFLVPNNVLGTEDTRKLYFDIDGKFIPLRNHVKLPGENIDNPLKLEASVRIMLQGPSTSPFA